MISVHEQCKKAKWPVLDGVEKIVLDLVVIYKTKEEELNGTPDAYRIAEYKDGVMVFGLFNGAWVVNPCKNYLIKHLTVKALHRHEVRGFAYVNKDWPYKNDRGI